MSLFKEHQVKHIIHRSILSNDFKTTIYDGDNAFLNQIPAYEDDGTQKTDQFGNPVYDEVPKDVKEQSWVVRKLSLDVSQNCYLIINDEYWNKILIRNGGVTTFDYEDINVKKLTLMQHPNNKNKENVIYMMCGLSPAPKQL